MHLWDSSCWFETINLRRSIVYTRGHSILFPNKMIFLSLKIFYVFANGLDPDEKPFFVSFHQSFHSLSSTHLGAISIQRVKVCTEDS